MDNQAASLETFEPVRGRLFGIAYRMLGSVAEAEDAVQETYLRCHQADRASIRNAESWLVTVVTRLGIDRLRTAQRERETYVGPWLPEPLIAATPPPDRGAEQASDLSLAFLLLLERLAPEERAAFLLRDVFDREYREIAGVLGKSEPACRQMIRRSRARIRDERRRFSATAADKSRLLRQFSAALQARDQEALLGLFSPDATWTADGGGRAPAARRPILGSDRIIRLVLGLQRQFVRRNAAIERIWVNGEPGLSVRIEGELRGVLAVDTDGERIREVFSIVNPQKLRNHSSI